MDKEIITIIPARGGSKGIQNKNIIPLAGKPLISYTIEHSNNSKFVSKTFVSTEDKEIQEISKEYAAEIIKRPEKLAQDETATEPVLEHAIEYLKENNYKPDIIVFLQCTSPLRREDDIDNAIEKLIKEDYDSVFSVTENKYFIWRKKDNDISPINYDYKNRPRRQDREKEYIENGSIYVFKTEKFEQEKNRICGKKGFYIMPFKHSFEIDKKFDLWICEQILKR